jgi:acetolactate synthase-1/2/3 large subunit
VIEAPELAVSGLSASQLEECCRMLSEAHRPVIYAGGGVIASGTSDALLQFAERVQCPVTTTIMGYGAFPHGHPLALHCLGMHGSKYANVAINEADLVIALGVRFDDRVTGNVREFIKHGKIIHIDIDRGELNKNKPVTLSICADLRLALIQLIAAATPAQSNDWIRHVTVLRERFPFSIAESPRIKPQHAIAVLSEKTAGEAIVSLGVGQHQMWAMQHYRSARPRSFLSSSGFGTMGYGLPAAIGAKVACPDRLVIDIDGDGSLNMTVHELATCHRHNIGVKVVVINNQWLGMVRQWQDMIYEGHRSGSAMEDPMTTVKPQERPDIYPDFVTIAAGYRVRAERVTEKSQLQAAYSRMLADPGEPFLLDIIVEREENVYPMIPAGGSYRDIIMGPDAP